MVALKKHNLSGEEVGEVSVDDAFLQVEANAQMIKDYIVAMRANARQWSANTKGRSEVSHSNKKPHKQKGTGGARQGTLAAPQCRGGGVVFGPKPKFDQHVRINRKERRLVNRQLLAEKIQEAKVFLLEDSAFSNQKPSTKSAAQFLAKLGLSGKRVLFVDGVNIEPKQVVFKQSVNNLPRSQFAISKNVNGYDLALAHGLVMTESALNELVDLLKEGKNS